MFTPKTHRVRHKILAFLTEKRRVQQANKRDIKEAQFTIDEIAKSIKADWHDVNRQLNVLWRDDQVRDINVEGQPQRYMVSKHGISLASSEQILIDGRLIRSQLFNNYASGLFQIIIGLVALYTIYANLTTIDTLQMRLDRVESEIEHKAEPATESSSNKAHNSSSKIRANDQTHSQTEDTLKMKKE